MKITIGAAMALALLTATLPAGSAPEDDRNNLIRILRERYPGVPLNDYVHGALISSQDTMEQYEQLMTFPPFQNKLDKGKALWEKPFANGKTFASCFPAGGSNVAGNYPYFDDALNQVVTFEMALNDCLRANGEAQLQLDDMNTTGVLTAHARSLSDGMAMNIKVQGPKALAAYEAGRRLFFSRRGQFDFSCAVCHVDQAGKRIRSEFLSPVVGQATHWPAFRREGDDPWTLQRRYTICYEFLRVPSPAIGSEEFNTLEYFHSYLSNGLPMKASVFRK